MHILWLPNVNVPDIKHKATKLLEENIRENLCGPGWGDEFLDKTLKAYSTKKNWRVVVYPHLKRFIYKRHS